MTLKLEEVVAHGNWDLDVFANDSKVVEIAYGFAAFYDLAYNTHYEYIVRCRGERGVAKGLGVYCGAHTKEEALVIAYADVKMQEERYAMRGEGSRGGEEA